MSDEHVISTRAGDIDESVGYVTVTHQDGDTLVALKVTDEKGQTVTVWLDWRGSVDLMAALGACATKL